MKRVPLCAIAALLVFVMGGCGSSKTPQALSGAAAATKANTAQSATAAPAGGGSATTVAKAAAVTVAPGAAKPASTQAVALPTATIQDVALADATPEAEDTAEPAPAEEEGLNLDSREEGLDSLSSYRMTWNAEWSGTEDGVMQTGSWNWVEEYNADPEALHWMWKVESSKDQSADSTLEWWQVGSTTYMISGENNECFSMSTDDPDTRAKKGSVFNPGSLGRVEDAKYVGEETVNGVQSKHYTYDDAAGSVFGTGKVNGEIWVAVDGGFVVKEVTSWTGGAGLFGIAASAETDGKGSWEWELSDVNEAIAIEPPEDCGGAANDLPIMPDATDKNSFGDMTSYSTASTVEDVAAFYQEAMPAAGWEEAKESTTLENMVILNFSKGDQNAQVMISKDDDKTAVIISISK